MYYAVITLFAEEHLDDVYFALAEVGVTAAVVADAEDIQRRLIHDVPIFAGFREAFGAKHEFCRLIFAQMGDDHVVDAFLNALRDVGVDFTKEDTGTIVILPVARYIGFEEDVESP